MPHLEILESELRKFQLDLSSPQKLTLARYCDELVRWNKKINLTGLTGADMVRRLVVEPAWIGFQLKPSGVLADIGSGNGSPAIPLHVISKFEKSHLIEARAKRAAFLRHVVATIELRGITIHRSRFEDVAPSLGSVDWVTLQGVSLSSELLDSISRISLKTTTVVWITSDLQPPMKPVKELTVPITGTQVFLFHLDLS